MTNEQLAAFTAFGLLVADSKASLLEYMSIRELKELCAEADKYLSPQIGDDDDMVSPIVAVLREAIEEAKA